MEYDLSGLSIPRHVAVIMDGNGRWAQQRGLPRLEGHLAGRHATRRVVEAASDFGVQVFSLYAFSTENWSRPSQEVTGLLDLIEGALLEELSDLCRNNVRLVPTGRLGELPESLQRTLAQVQQDTAGNTGLVLNLLVNYGGRAEIVDAARRFAERVQAGLAQPADLSEAELSRYLYAPELPDPDVLIRPGGEQRVSNFLLWEIAYTEIVTLDVLWPDFGAEHLLEAIREYNRRRRRYGGIEGGASPASPAPSPGK